MRIDELKRLGYRIAANMDGQIVSLYGKDPISSEIGSVVRPRGNGLYLGTVRDFAINYYSGSTDYPDVLLTYSYKINDLLDGDPEMGISKPPRDGGEIRVRQAILVDIEYLPQD